MTDTELLVFACILLFCIAAFGWVSFFSERFIRKTNDEIIASYQREVSAARKAIVVLIRERNQALRRVQDEGDWWKESE